ncbi:hypothetical protein LCGC14_0805690 [marine sediment metagenome]|uniref:Uncharacterized protein n=1 Tax=marine sediment metagenome TaxID=412755 RepID=A0A0F9PN76_9ZZZZ
MFCKHDDNILDKTIMESAYEQTTAVTRAKVADAEMFFRKKLIILLKYKKCKRVKKIVETNP